MKFIGYSVRKSRLTFVIILIAGTSLFFTPTAQAAVGSTAVICSTSDGQQRSYQISWDNSNQFFADKGYIPAFYCTGGYAGSYRIYISDSLNGGPLGYFQGVVPQPVEEPVQTPADTSTATVDTSTATSDTNTTTSDTSTSTVDTSTATVDTSTSTTDTSTATVDTSTATVDTSTATVDTSTLQPAPVDGSTATSQPSPQPDPIPQPVPVVIPDPDPVVVPEPEVVEPTPEPEPITEPTATEPEVEPEVEPTEPEVEPEIEPEVESIEIPKDEVTLPNGVVLTQEQAVAIALLQNPAELLQELFTNPAAALAAFGAVGADMTPEVREKSEKVVISAIIVGNIATQAASIAGAAATYRRNP
jgi:hypothetical protein